MRRGLFGKVQSKRDFISHGMPRGFLSVWEPWIQSSVASSRMQLGESWQAGFLTAPIWRFWLGADVCGEPVIGAFTPSMDGVGRYFPLTIAAFGGEGEAISPPETDPQEAWFASVEDYLLMALEKDLPFERLIELLEALPDPGVASSETGRPVVLPRGYAVVRVGETSFAQTCRAAREACELARTFSASTFWWTDGGGGYERLAFAALGMPDASVFADMITGRFDARPAASVGG
jgi:type VI secretion system protein ImpM